MNEKDLFKQEYIRALINDWLGSVQLDEAPDMQKISPAKLESYKSAAKRALQNAAFQGEANRIVEMAKTKIALETKSDLEITYWRGTINGIKLLHAALVAFAQGQDK